MATLIIILAVVVAWIALAVVVAVFVSRTIRKANAEELVVREPALNTAAAATSPSPEAASASSR